MTLQAPPLLTSSVGELVSLRPREPRQHDAGDPVVVEALIEEARRRTRRRRRRYGACALLAAAAVALVGFEHSGGGSTGPALGSSAPARPAALPAAHLLRGNGALTIMVGGNGEEHSGIFEVAEDGHLRSVFPAPRPCYQLESADWSPDGKRLAVRRCHDDLGGERLRRASHHRHRDRQRPPGSAVRLHVRARLVAERRPPRLCRDEN